MKTKVLVTGGTGYIASWVIKYLLEQGHQVHTTVRDLKNEEKTRHLLKMDEENTGDLKLFEADLLEEGSFRDAMEGVEYVFHMASPFQVYGIKNPKKQLIDPALQGTRNVLTTANKSEKVKRVVLTSSVAAVYGDNSDINRTPDGIFTEEHWNTTSNEKHQPYNYSKTLAEREAWKIQEGQNQWDLTTINPGFVMGPSLSTRTDSTSISFMRSLLNGDFKQGVPGLYFGVVDVRDVAHAHIQAAFRPEAKGRHILVSESLPIIEMAAFIREKFPDYPLPSKSLPKWMLFLMGPFMGFSWKFTRNNIGIPLKFDNSFSKENLGIKYRPVGDSLKDHAEQIIRDGLIDMKK